MGNLSGLGAGGEPTRPPSADELTKLRGLVVAAEEGIRAAHAAAVNLLPARDPLLSVLERSRSEAAAARLLVGRRWR